MASKKEKEEVSLTKLIPLFCDLAKNPVHGETCSCKFNSATSTLDLFGFGTFKIWLNNVPVGSCDDFEVCMSLQQVKSLFSNFYNPNIRKSKNGWISVSSETKLKKSKSEFGVPNNFFDRTEEELGNYSLSENVQDDADHIIFLSKYVNDNYKEILYHDGYFICIPSNNFGSMIAIRSLKKYDYSFSIPLELVKVFTTINKLYPGYAITLDINKNRLGLLRIGDFLTIQFTSNDAIVSKFEGRSLDSFLLSDNDIPCIQFSSIENIDTMISVLQQFKRNSSVEDYAQFILELNEEGNKLGMLSTGNNKIEFVEVNLYENTIYPDKVHKFCLTLPFISMLEGMKELIGNGKVRFMEILNRHDRYQLVIKDDSDKYIFITSAYRVDDHPDYLRDEGDTLKQYLEKRFKFKVDSIEEN